MKSPFVSVPALGLSVLVFASILSGCSLVWIVPVQGAGASVVVLFLLLGAASAYGAGIHRAIRPDRSQVGEPSRSQRPAAALVAGRPGMDGQWQAPAPTGWATTTEEVSAIEGDGIEEPLVRAWLDDLFRGEGGDSEFVVLGRHGIHSQSRAQGPRGEATKLAAGDGFGPPWEERAERPGGIPAPGFIVLSAAPSPDAASDDVSGAPVLDVNGDGFNDRLERGLMLTGNWEKLNPVEGDPDAIKRGGVRFNTRCGTYCHGGRGIGGGCPSLVDEAWIHGEADKDVFRTIVGGRQGTRMGAFGGDLTVDQIWDIITYLQHRKTEFLLEKAGPGSLREKSRDCLDNAHVHIVTIRNRTYSGILVIEDKDSVTVEDRSDERPTRYRVKKKNISTSEVSCAVERMTPGSDQPPQGERPTVR